MNQNLTEMIFVLDESGSMSSLTDDTIGGFNGLIQSQKDKPGSALVTTVLFANNHKTIHNGLDIREVEPMTRDQYRPGGGTALLDAVGDTIQSVQDRHDSLPESERPAHVLFVITTDGQENVSRKYKRDQIKKMIQHQNRGHGWEFIFMGANVDSFAEAASLGVTYSYDYASDPFGINQVYTAMDCVVTATRSGLNLAEAADEIGLLSASDTACSCAD